jgi:hypothetical protein
MPDTTTTEQLPRIFKIGTTTIHEDESLRNLSLDEVTAILAHQYPQVLNATRLEHEENGTHIVSYTPKSGSKG